MNNTIKTPLVDIVVLNYNGFDDTVECIQSLIKIDYLNYRVVIIDNNSTDNSILEIENFIKKESYEYLFFDSYEEAINNKSQKPKFSLIQTGCNGGYGFGNNIGIKYALANKSDYILILNNDTIVTSNFLNPMINMFYNNPQIGILGSKIYYYDNPNIIWFNGGKFSKYTSKVTHFDFNNKDSGQNTRYPITFLTGCVWLIPRNVIKKVGLINLVLTLRKLLPILETLFLLKNLMKKA